MINYIFQLYRTLNDSDTQDMFGLVSYANEVSGSILMPMMLAVVFFISLLGMVFSGRPFSRALTFSGFICSILGILLAIMGMLNKEWMYLCFFITGIGLIWTRFVEAPS